jgi:LmbE family N-acetylglucosaminyl deacetylase
MERSPTASPSDRAAESFSRGKVLFIFAHHDDEFFVLPRIQREIQAGNEVFFLYTTDGRAYGEDSNRRLSETTAVLLASGATRENIISIGIDAGISDGASHKAIARLWESVRAQLSTEFSRVYTMAWEGGHVDHDVAHLIGVALVRLGRVQELWEFSGYRSLFLSGPLFRCLSLLPAATERLLTKLSFGEALRWLWTATKYPSQRKTFLGLAPMCLYPVLIRRKLECQLVPPRDYLTRPHPGVLLYESLFRVPFREFVAATTPFIEEWEQR